MRSLLSAEGIRWFFGRFAYVLATPCLSWLVLGIIAYGVLKTSTLLRLHRPMTLREQFSLRVVLVEMLVVVLVMALLTLLPQPLLLTATGGLAHSSFLHSLIPVVCFTVVVTGLTYGVCVGVINSLTEAFDALVVGFKPAAPMFLFYVLGALLYHTICFVFYI